MFIQTETTPNPATMMFIPGEAVLTTGTANFTEPEEGGRSPLARRLFEVDGVVGVFLGSDFVTVTKGADQSWDVLKPIILGAIMDHLHVGRAGSRCGAQREARPQEPAMTGSFSRSKS